MVTAGLDFGTQSVKLLIYDTDERKVLSLTSHSFDLITGDGGVREQKAEWFIEGLRDCFGKVDGEIKRRIDAIGVSGQQHGFVPVDANGNVLAPVKLWCDTSTSSECDELTSLYGTTEDLIRNVGNAFLPGYTAGKIYSFKKKHPDLYSKMKYVMLPHDYINYYLTGNAVMERGDASGTALYNIYENCWDERVCALIDPLLMTHLPPVKKHTESIGCVRREIAGELGLRDSVIVSTGGGDNMMSAIGTGCVRNGNVTISLGTSGTLFALSDKPVSDRMSRIAAFASSSGAYLPLLCTMNCTVASENMRKLFSLDVEAFSDLASSSPIGSEGLIMLPFFNGERVPSFPRGEGVLAGMTMTNIKPSNVARATLEGVSFGFLLGLEAFNESGFVPESVTLTGGGSNSALWRQIISDMTALEVRVPSVREAAAFGAALQALSVCSKRDIKEVVDTYLSFDEEKKAVPVLKNREKYLSRYRKWKLYCDTLSPVFR